MTKNIEDPFWQVTMLVFSCVVMVVGSLGNLLTLAAIPYVRRRYPKEFSLLQLPVTDLLINLSVCDLIYGSFGLTHMIHGLVIGTNPYADWPVLDLGGWQLDFCWLQGTVRNVAVVADFNTMGAIACCVCYYNLCRQCRAEGGPHNHDNHDGISASVCLPGRTMKIRSTYVVIFGIWLLSLLAISPDFTGAWGEFKWTNTVYGCDAVYKTNYGFYKTNYGFPILVIINLILMLLSYSVIFWQTRHYFNDHCSHTPRSHTRMLVMLSLTYAVCIVPAMGTCWGLWDVGENLVLENLFTCIYWCMYGINFVLYIAISNRMRLMYARFLSDMWNQLKTKKVLRDKILTTLSSSSASRAFALKKKNAKDEYGRIFSSRKYNSPVKKDAFQVQLSIISSHDSFHWKIYQK